MPGPNGTSAPALVPTLDPSTSRILLNPPTPQQLTWDHSALLLRTRSVVLDAIAASLPTAHPDRVLYAVAGRSFVAAAPRPIGGKTKPAYKEFGGSTADELLGWLLERAVAAPLGGRGRKKTEAGLALEFVVSVVNHVLEAELAGRKDEVDENALRGMEWAGHQMKGKIMLPRHLRSVQEEGPFYVSTARGRLGRDIAAYKSEDRVGTKPHEQ
ncbi:hypothetical protein HK101_011012 [Irineochytrium annulatum]|nr:hypothetical protein HK101_011012 [Irineochytrium annulatum]